MSWLETVAALLLLFCSTALLLFLRWADVLDERNHPALPTIAAPDVFQGAQLAAVATRAQARDTPALRHAA